MMFINVAIIQKMVDKVLQSDNKNYAFKRFLYSWGENEAEGPSNTF